LLPDGFFLQEFHLKLEVLKNSRAENTLSTPRPPEIKFVLSWKCPGDDATRRFVRGSIRTSVGIEMNSPWRSGRLEMKTDLISIAPFLLE
jgi:hypothetical protein